MTDNFDQNWKRELRMYKRGLDDSKNEFPMNKMFFLTSIVAGVESVCFCSSSLQAVIDFLHNNSLTAINYHIFSSCDFLSVRFIDHKLLID